MLILLIFIGIFIILELGVFIYFISKNYNYAVKNKKSLTYLIPDAVLLFSIILWIILFIVIIYFLKMQGWGILV